MDVDDYDFFAEETNEDANNSNSAPSPANDSASSLAIDDAPLRSAIAEMMFANGDGVMPNDECKELLLRLLREQLASVLSVAQKHAQDHE